MIDIPESIKELYIEGLAPKRVQIKFPNGEYGTIGNENIVAESLEFRENLSQGDELKFGICEASMVKFDAYNVPSIKGLTVKAYHGVYSDALGWWDIPLGVFTVTEQKIDKKTGKNTITAYTPSIQSNDICPYEKFRTQEILHTSNVDHNFNVDILAMECGLPAPEGSTETNFSSSDFVQVSSMPMVHWQYSVMGFSGEGDFAYYTFTPKQTNPTRNIYRFTLDNFEYTQEDKDILATELRNHFDAKPFKIYVGAGQKEFSFGLEEWIPFETDSNQTIYIFTGSFSYQNFALGKDLSVNFKDCFQRVTVPNPSFFYHTIDLNQRTKLNGTTYYQANAKQVDELDFSKMLISYFEIQGKILRYDRYGVLRLVDVQQIEAENVYPAIDLYPATSIYPADDSGSIGRYSKANYSEVDAEATPVDSFGTVAIKYKCSDPNNDNNGKEVLYKYKSSNGKYVYSVDDNFYCLNYSEYASGQGIRAYSAEDFAKSIGEQAKDISYTPFEMSAQAMPWVEVGDTVRISTANGVVPSILFSRTMKGIQYLTDDLEAPVIETEDLYTLDSTVEE